jgi:geranylgeranyl diphosphate synthase, type II
MERRVLSAAGSAAGGGAAFDLRSYLGAEVLRVEVALDGLVEALPATAPSAIREPIRYALGTRGKRLRPALCVAAYRAIGDGGAPDPVYRLACALEIVHTYSLVHDDLPCMDDDDLRRGRPTVHREHGVAAAVLAGAALLPLAARTAADAAADLGLDAATRGRIVAELCRAAGGQGMVGGQLLDLEAEGLACDGPALEAIHRAKTGALLAAALRIGGIAAGADQERLAALTVYGESVGLAFQIADDILDVTADSDALGKTAGKDQDACKATYPALYGLDGARALARERADRAVAALRGGGIRSAPLEALAAFVVERRR